MERVFQASAAVLIGAAAVFLWLENFDAVFVSLVLGSVSYFLSVRVQVKRRLKVREEQRLADSLAEMNGGDETKPAIEELAEREEAATEG